VQSQTRKRRQALVATRLLCVVPAALVARPALAQERDSVVVRRVSTWQTDVDRLKQQLLSQRMLEGQLARKFTEIEMRKRAALPDSQVRLSAQAQLLFVQMREAAGEQARLRREIETLCEAVRKPEGWLGVVTTGMQLVEKRSDGTKIIRYLEPPSVASVDPGSPAERVGVRSGDVLVEVGGQRVLRQNIVFAELLRPGREIELKLQRGNEVITLTPTVEPLPQVVSTNSCAWVDMGTAYVVAPSQAPTIVRMQPQGEGGSGYRYELVRPRRDSARVRAAAPVPATASSAVYAGPMVGYLGGSNSLAGLQLVTLSAESSRALGVEHGILVNQVLPGTPGREAGLLGGDVLISADSVELRSILTLQRVISRSADRNVTLLIVRDRKRETVQLRW
jgi:C-terminal processing protease CtpA/Prc